MKKKCFLVSLVLLSLLSCFNSNSNNSDDDGCPPRGTVSYSPKSCSIMDMNEFVYNVLNDTYLWVDQVQPLDYREYEDPDDLLDAVKDKTLDKWSYITTKEYHSAYFNEGKYLGYGFSLVFKENHEVRLSFVYETSPAGLAGLTRGDKILEVNDMSVSDIDDGNLWGNIFGDDQEGVTSDLVIEHANGSIDEYTLEKRWITMNTVLHRGIINHGESTVGHLVFNKFLGTSEDELVESFDYFKEHQVDELVLDLRYNGGGYLYIARGLSALIAGDQAAGKVFCTYKHNDNYECWDQSMDYPSLESSLDLNRVFVITTESTCSASETVINCLKPYIDVIVIGDTTCGKPVGMYAHDFCDWSISAIELQVLNANDEGDYFDGISPMCSASDDVSKTFDDSDEDSLSTALQYISTNSCDVSQPKKKPSDKKTGPTHKLKGFRQEIGAF